MNKPNVLIADNEGIIALDLKKTLEQWGFNIEATFRKGEDLLRFAQEDDPHILIMDTFLAGELNAFETAKEVLKTNKVPVIFTSGQSHKEYSKDVDIGGRYEYLHKPFSKEQLKETIKKVFPEFSSYGINFT